MRAVKDDEKLMPLCTVIMPVYNEGKYIAFGIESVLYQDTTFPVRLLIVDDASDDDTPAIVERYQKHVSSMYNTIGLCEIVYIRQKRNRGKGYALYTAYRYLAQHQQGGYFVILDGDDFFSHREKLQKQVDVLEKSPSLFGCGHEYIAALRYGSYSILVNAHYKQQTWYEQLIHEGIHNLEDYPEGYYYSCSSAMMYRNIFTPPPIFFYAELEKGIPKYFAKRALEGDTVLMLWFTIITGKRVGHIDFVGSVYNIHGRGIWTGLTVAQKIDDSKKAMFYLERAIDNPEYTAKLGAIANDFEGAIVNEDMVYATPYKEYHAIYDIILKIQMGITEHDGKTLYICSYIDNILESIGKIFAMEADIYTLGKEYNRRHIGILYSGCVDEEKIYHRIRTAHEQGMDIYVFCTGYVNSISEEMGRYCGDLHIPIFTLYDSKTTYIDSVEENITYILQSMYACDIGVLYCYLTCGDIVGICAMQYGVAEEICLDISYTNLIHGIGSSVVDAVIVDDVDIAHALCSIDVMQCKAIYVNDRCNPEYVFCERCDMDIALQLEESSFDIIDVSYA